MKPQTPTQPLSYTADSSCSLVPSDGLEETSPSRNCHKAESADSPSRTGEKDTEEKTNGKEKDRETAILDDGDPSSPGSLRRERACCSRADTKCNNMGWERERESCLSNGHCLGRCNSIKNHPKSLTLPALTSKSVPLPLHSPHMELCHRHSAHPLPGLPWERPPPPLPPPCIHRPCYPYSSPEHAHPHSHTLPASNRLCSEDDRRLFHYSPHSPPSHLSHQSLPSSPYRELIFSSPTPSSGCPCRDCSGRREHHPVSVRTFHPFHTDQTQTPWSLGAGVPQTRGVPPLWERESPWEVQREADFWQCKSAVPMFRACQSSLDQSTNLEQPRFALTPQQSPHSMMDVRDGASSGYYTPPLPRHSCPCSPYQSSPAESHESRGYASGYHSGSASPLPASSPSPGRGRMPETPPGSRKPQHAEGE